MNFDIFNGDADGICSLIQYRLANPANNQLITGVKRDIDLLRNLPDDVTSIYVFDISLEKNISFLKHHIKNGANIFYCDHHRAGTIPKEDNCHFIIDTSKRTCTSLLTNKLLSNKFVNWAVVGAFGDNLCEEAYKLSLINSLSSDDVRVLKELGVLINYNSYGIHITDLNISPLDLYEEFKKYNNPIDIVTNKNQFYLKLKSQYQDDLEKLSDIEYTTECEKYTITIMPNTSFSRRLSGVLANKLSEIFPDKAHAILVPNVSNDYYIVSVRSPSDSLKYADELCILFKTGGGRKAAAGINKLVINDFHDFKYKFIEHYTN